jgi:hypothetical protein
MSDSTFASPSIEAIRTVMDRFDIQDTISRYSQGQDAHQGDDPNILEQWDETFSDEATVDYSAAAVRRGPTGSYRGGCAGMTGRPAA